LKRQSNSNFLYNAPTFVIVSHLKNDGNALPDSALAMGNMMVAAHSLGIGSCWVNQLPGMTNMPLIMELLRELDIPENHIVFATAVFGYSDEVPKQKEPRLEII
jgi:nitroreductase